MSRTCALLPSLAAAYQVLSDTIAHVPGLSKGEPYSAAIFYPKEAMSATDGGLFPVVSYLHGTTGGREVATNYKSQLEAIASYGFIVVATMSCPDVQCGAAFSTDQLAILQACRDQGAALHPALAQADFSKAAIAGHSMGAMATVQSATSANVKRHNIVAAVAQHTCIDQSAGQPGSAADIDVPILYTSGGADNICLYSYTNTYTQYTPKSRWGVISWNNAGHYECIDGYGQLREVAPAARFLACHVRGEHCSGINFCKDAGADVCFFGNTTTTEMLV